MELLCIGDVHLGRPPARVPEAVIDALGGRTPGPAMALERAIGYALERGVDAVVFAGDVVDDGDDFYEALTDLRREVERLGTAGIAALAVTGNHDTRVLPRLAEHVDGFRLLGAGGRWEVADVAGADGEHVRLLGWSFPEPEVRASPLASGLPERSPLPTVGLLHCDRDAPGSRHAPVTSTELAGAPVDAWLLGHIHRPDALSGDRPMGYLGSLTGLDPGEPGAHGPWLLSVNAGRFGVEHVPLAPLHWCEIDVSVDALETADAVHGAIADAVGELHDGLAAAGRLPEAVGCRLRLRGRSRLRAAIERDLASANPRATPIERGSVTYFVHDWRVDILPAIALGELAEGTDPAALLARKLLVLRGEDCEDRRALIEAARERLAPIPQRRPFDALGAAPADDATVAATLERAALQALDELLAQREGEA